MWENYLIKKHKQNMIFSNTEFYYTPKKFISGNNIIITGDEAKHIVKVMRHSINDKIFVTNGEGIVYKAIIENITKKEVVAAIKDKFTFVNKTKKITFCIPILKSADRFEFALEKCVELGITNFLIFNAKKSYKRGVKIERWERILLAAMKQSLRAFKPKVEFTNSLKTSLANKSNVIVFEQNAGETLKSYLENKSKIEAITEEETYFIFGPEGGLTEEELNIENGIKLKLTDNRLRAETAVITVGSFLGLEI